MTTTLDLNSEQRTAVEHAGGAVLVIAGAGSGKTRVLTARVARLVAEGVAPGAILAFTFTNRAAREMRARIERVVGAPAGQLWVGTFHATCVRILRREAAAGTVPGLSRAFVIYDREDQEALVGELLDGIALPGGSLKTSEVLYRISDAKNALVSPAEFARTAMSPAQRAIAGVYDSYQRALRQRNALDFDDLIAEVVTLFRDRPDVAGRYAKRFHHVLVDEYQDTNHAQFRLVEALASGHGNLFVVGDDDQSIYRFRGADLGNVLEFERAFPGAAVVRLEQNYRSTATILRAANAVIANNRHRKGKTLWCEREDGARITFALCADDVDEAKRVRGQLERHRRRGGRLDDCAVLYRTNAQSRAIETELRLNGIRYEMVGGVAFFARREVKDLLAYLRVAANPNDRVAFWRVWNTPRRGLGDAVRARIEERGAEPPLEALRAVAVEGLKGAARGGAESFLGLVDELRARLAEPPAALLRLVIDRTGYLETLDPENDERATDRRANLEELIAAAEEYAARGPGEAGSDLVAGFLAEATLTTDADRVEEGADRVLLLTAHTAKGLEFPLVIATGLEEGLWPHAQSANEAKELEEERRLFYVALTRARDEVLLTAAAYRRRFTPDGSFVARGGAVSRFIDEIPAELMDREETAAQSARIASSTEYARRSWSGAGRGGAGLSRGGHRSAGEVADGPAFRTTGKLTRTVGKEVFHETFGRGVVVMAEGEGAEVRFTVRFGTQLKKVMGRYLTGGADVD